MINRRRVAAIQLLAMLALAIRPAQAQHARGLIADDPVAVARVLPVPVYRDILPHKVDIRPFLPPVGNQGSQGSCTAWATAYGAMTAAYKAELSHRLGPQQPLPDLRFSPAYVYNQIHQGTCDGTSIITTLDAIRDKGLAPLTDFPYTANSCARLPDAEQLQRFRAQRLVHYRRIDLKQEDRLDKLRGGLYEGHPVVAAIYTAPNGGAFDKYRGGIFETVAERDGGHAVLLVGYDDDEQTFLILNSWGTQWGEQGFMRVRYETFFANAFGSAAYVIDQLDPDGVSAVAATLAPPPPEPAPAPQPAPPPSPTPEPAPAPPPPPSRWTMESLAKEIASLPAAHDCGRVEVRTTQRELKLEGFAASRADLADAIKRLEPPPEIAIDATTLRELPWPQCEVELDYGEGAGVHHARWALEVGGLPQAGPVPPGTALQIGVRHAGPEPVFLYAFYIQAFRDGNVTPLYQPVFGRDGKPRPSTLSGMLNLNEPVPGIRREFVVTPPLGPEALLMIAARKPLFKHPVGPGEWTERELLTRLRQAFAQLKRAGDILATDATLITTGEHS